MLVIRYQIRNYYVNNSRALPIPSLQCLLVGKSKLLASGSIETRP